MDDEIVFNLALATDASQRDACLDEACQGDVALRARVERLLAEHHRQQSFLLDKPPSGLDATTYRSVTEGPGAVIGPYKLLQQIGEGGMGVVFMAEQTVPLQRTVALKIIKPGMDTRQVIARFEAERQALALMDHPNIAKVLDAGTTASGRPYFVMELVKGVPITTYCDDAHLTVRTRLELFFQVCQAVQHAHQKGVIHRDIKPTNVMVTEYDDHAVPKVIDFGVAKATAQKLTERTMFTEFGQVLGTVEYMSPEQAKLNQLDVDTRSDIYSLGVLLYELLAGSTPFGRNRLQEAAFDEMLRIIREEDPPKPSTRLSASDQLPSIAANRGSEPKKLSGLIRGELDWVAMKALEKDRNRRYETANGLAMDVQRYLCDDPVQACPPTAVYRFRKFARRNRSALLIASVCLAGLLALIVGLSVSNRLIAAERNEKAKALVMAEVQTKRASANFWRANIAIRELMTKLAANGNELPPQLRKQFRDEAVKYFDAMLQEDDPDPTLRYEAGVGYRAMAMLHDSWGDSEQTEHCYQQAILVLSRVVAEHPANQQYRQQLGYAYSRYGDALNRRGRFQESQNALSHGKKVYEKLLAEIPDSFDFAFELADLLSRSINPYGSSGQMRGAEDAYLRAVEILERLIDGRSAPDPYPDGHKNGFLLGILAQTHGNWAHVLVAASRYDDARRVLRYSVRTLEKAHRKHSDVARHAYSLAHAHHQIGSVALKQEKLDDAEAEFQRAIKIYELCKSKYSGQRAGSFAPDAPYAELARLLIKTGRFSEAMSIAIRGAEADPSVEDRAADAKFQVEMGDLLREARDLKRSIEMYSLAIAADEKLLNARLGRGQCRLDLGQFNEAIDDFDEAISLEPNRSEGWSGRGGGHLQKKQWKAAIEDYSRAIDLAPEVHTNWFHRGIARMEINEWENAVADFTKVVEGWPTEPGGWYLRGASLAQAGHPGQAIADLRQAVTVGYADVGQLQSDARLEPLRSRSDFIELLSLLESQQQQVSQPP